MYMVKLRAFYAGDYCGLLDGKFDGFAVYGVGLLYIYRKRRAWCEYSLLHSDGALVDLLSARER